MRRGLAPSREQAQAAVAAGRVLVDGAPAHKASRRVRVSAAIDLVGDGPRFVSRGGEKLAAALDRFGVDVDGRTAVDVGASTGGFTDCLLQRGAAAVVALDVGHGQLHPSLRTDARVTVLERTDVRAAALEPADVVVADLSFISLRLVAADLVRLTKPGGDLVVLVKPQFEAGPAAVAAGKGVIRDATVRERAVEDVRAAFAAVDAAMIGLMTSPLPGGSGNIEHLAHLRAP